MSVLSDDLDITTASKDALGFALLAAKEEVRDLRIEVTRLQALLHARAQYEQGERIAHALCGNGLNLFPVPQ